MAAKKTIYRVEHPHTGEILYIEKGGKLYTWATFCEFPSDPGAVKHLGFSNAISQDKAAASGRASYKYGQRHTAARATVVTAEERDAEIAARSALTPKQLVLRARDAVFAMFLRQLDTDAFGQGVLVAELRRLARDADERSGGQDEDTYAQAGAVIDEMADLLWVAFGFGNWADGGKSDFIADLHDHVACTTMGPRFNPEAVPSRLDWEANGPRQQHAYDKLNRRYKVIDMGEYVLVEVYSDFGVQEYQRKAATMTAAKRAACRWAKNHAETAPAYPGGPERRPALPGHLHGYAEARRYFLGMVGKESYPHITREYALNGLHRWEQEQIFAHDNNSRLLQWRSALILLDFPAAAKGTATVTGCHRMGDDPVATLYLAPNHNPDRAQREWVLKDEVRGYEVSDENRTAVLYDWAAHLEIPRANVAMEYRPGQR
jgi:hypothetical protein